jgi:hypothetical protein
MEARSAGISLVSVALNDVRSVFDALFGILRHAASAGRALSIRPREAELSMGFPAMHWHA